jgi:hypothetical protein
MKEQMKNNLLWGVIVVVALVLLFGTGIINIGDKFVITDDDFQAQPKTTVSYTVGSVFEDSNLSLISIINNTMNLTYYGKNYNISSGNVYYTIDTKAAPFNASTFELLGTMPNLSEGLHNVNKLKFNITNSTSFILETWSLKIFVQDKVVSVTGNVSLEQICSAVGGNYTNSTCSCPNGDKWNVNSTTKACGPVTKTVEKEVKIEPTFFQKYGIAIFAVIIAGIVIIIMGGKKKRK